MKPYYDEGGITIYHGDALHVLADLDPVDLVLTDPPYNIGKEYGSQTDDARGEDAYAAWCAQWFGCLRAAKTILFPGVANLPIWMRSSHPPTATGCWFMPGNPGRGFPFSFLEWEPWLYWGGMLGGSSVVRVSISQQRDTGDHPCPKPLRLFRLMVERARADSILDPFMGSGTTLRAAKDLGRRAIGIEIEERYCEIAAKRLGQEVFDFGDHVGDQSLGTAEMPSEGVA